jgi:hypothetical protein
MQQLGHCIGQDRATQVMTRHSLIDHFSYQSLHHNHADAIRCVDVTIGDSMVIALKESCSWQDEFVW